MSEARGNNPADAAEREFVEVARRSDAEGLTSEVFHAVLGDCRSLRRGVLPTAWVFRIAANTIADHSARLAREGSIPNVEDISAEEERTVEADCRLGA